MGIKKQTEFCKVYFCPVDSRRKTVSVPVVLFIGVVLWGHHRFMPRVGYHSKVTSIDTHENQRRSFTCCVEMKNPPNKIMEIVYW